MNVRANKVIGTAIETALETRFGDVVVLNGATGRGGRVLVVIIGNVRVHQAKQIKTIIR